MRDRVQTAVCHSPGLLTVIVPTRNEAQNIQPLLERLAAALTNVPFEVLFMDDSTDNTPEAIAQAAPQFPFPVRVIARPPERRNGLSGAVVEGFGAARGEWLCVMDADLQHPPELIPALLARAQEAQADIVVGSRKADIFGPLGLSRKRAMTSQLLTLLARAWFPRLLKNVSDPLTGLFLVRRAALDVAALRPDGFKILLEILIRCPGLRVSEIQFDFARRHEGESKADLQEGMRFFRHLLRLRLTANQSFPRLVVVALSSLLLDVAAFSLLAPLLFLPWWLTAVFLAELIILLRFAATERWVLGRGHAVPGWPSLRRFWLTNQLSLFAARLPLLYLLLARWDWPAIPAITLAVVVEGSLRYGLSEQWVFSRRGVTMWQPGGYRYDIHGLLRLESQVPLPELAYFATPEPLPHVDLAIRVDRHGTPSPQPGAITYSEGLSRFGFGLAVMPGAAFTEVVLSPRLAGSPYALYKSVLEPLLRWLLAQRGCALLYGAALARDGAGLLLIPAQDAYKTVVALTAVASDDYAFMADDFVIVAADGRLFSFPKPVTMTPEVLRATAVALRRRERFRLWMQAVLYSRAGRAAGLQLSDRLPVATLNLLWQRLWSPPKREVGELVTAVALTDQAKLRQLILLLADDQPSPTEPGAFVCQRQDAVQGFPPYDLLLAQLPPLQGQEWRSVERQIIQRALAHLPEESIHYTRLATGDWQLLQSSVVNRQSPMAPLSHGLS